MFQLSAEETKSLLLQTARAKGRGGRQTPPYAFTEQGVAMLSSVLRSERAVQVNVQIMRAFVRMRQLLASHKGLMEKILAMEEKYDEKFQIIFKAIYIASWRRKKNPNGKSGSQQRTTNNSLHTLSKVWNFLENKKPPA